MSSMMWMMSKSLLSRPSFTPRLVTLPSSNQYSTSMEDVRPSELSTNFHIGGRQSVSGIVATVFGATGFVGRYVVNELGGIGSLVFSPYRGTDWSVKSLKPLGDLGQIVPLRVDVCNPESIRDVISKSNIVINLIGKRWGTKNYSIDESNHLIPTLIASVAKEVGVKRFIHVSSLGVREDSPSEWARAKANAEKSIFEVFPSATIVRPGNLYGYEDRTITTYAWFNKHAKIFPYFNGAMDKPMTFTCVNDLAQVIKVACNTPDTAGKIIEVGGQDFSLQEINSLVCSITKFPERYLSIPKLLEKHIFKFGFEGFQTPFFTLDEVNHWRTGEIIETDKHLTMESLGMKKTDLSIAAIRYIRHYRIPELINQAI